MNFVQWKNQCRPHPFLYYEVVNYSSCWQRQFFRMKRLAIYFGMGFSNFNSQLIYSNYKIKQTYQIYTRQEQISLRISHYNYKLIMLRKIVIRTLTCNPLPFAKTIHCFSHLNNTDFDQPFKEELKSPIVHQLNNYEQYLIKHNLALRKPHQKLRTEEERIIQKCLNEEKYAQTLNFLFNNSNRRLCSLSTVVNVDSILANRYQSLQIQLKKKAAFSLISFREQKVFNLFKKQVQKQITQNGIQSIENQSLFIYLYGQIITCKNLDFLPNLLTKKSLNKHQALQLVYQCLFYKKYKGIYHIDYNNLLTYLQLVLNPSLNKLQQLNREASKQRSHLQSLVQSFLKVLGYGNLRQCTVNNYKIDFLIDAKKQGTNKTIALQVNGNYHYTLDGKLKGREILRNMIINQCVPLRIVHQYDFLNSKGHRNKMAYIENLLTLNDVNWESNNEGWDSGWQVSQVQKLTQFPSQ